MTLDSLLTPKALLAGIFLAGAAYGSAQFQIIQIRGDVDRNRKKIETTQDMREQAARIDERTKTIREEQQRQRQMLEELLRRGR